MCTYLLCMITMPYLVCFIYALSSTNTECADAQHKFAFRHGLRTDMTSCFQYGADTHEDNRNVLV